MREMKKRGRRFRKEGYLGIEETMDIVQDLDHWGTGMPGGWLRETTSSSSTSSSSSSSTGRAGTFSIDSMLSSFDLVWMNLHLIP